MRFENKVAIVTGSSRGLGKVMALRLASEGADIVVNATKDRKGVEEVVSEIEKMGRRALPIFADITDNAVVENMVGKTVKEFGQINILINNAGVVKHVLTVDMLEEDWDWVVDVSLKGTFLCSKHVAKQMIKQGGGGKILSIASTAARTGLKFVSHYCAAKNGIIGFTRALAIELAPYKITVNAICPWYMSPTPMLDQAFATVAKLTNSNVETIKKDTLAANPLGRMGKPEEVAALAAFLCSNEADYITGKALEVDGGVVPLRGAY